MNANIFLRRNNFQSTIISSFKNLHSDQNLTDVTLVSEDGKIIESHKIVLSSSSPFFLDLLSRQRHPNPLIYMKGTRSGELEAMVEFLYKGEVSLPEAHFETFLGLAAELRLEGFGRQKIKTSLHLPKDETNFLPNSETSTDPPEKSIPQQVTEKNLNKKLIDLKQLEKSPVHLKKIDETSANSIEFNVRTVDTKQFEDMPPIMRQFDDGPANMEHLEERQEHYKEMPLVNDVCSEDFVEGPVNLKQLKTRSVALNITSSHVDLDLLEEKVVFLILFLFLFHIPLKVFCSCKFI